MGEPQLWEGACCYALSSKALLSQRPSTHNNHAHFGVQQSLLRTSSGITTLFDHAAHLLRKLYQKLSFALHNTTIHRCILRQTSDGVWQTHPCVQRSFAFWKFGQYNWISIELRLLPTSRSSFDPVPFCQPKRFRAWQTILRGP